MTISSSARSFPHSFGRRSFTRRWLAGGVLGLACSSLLGCSCERDEKPTDEAEAALPQDGQAEAKQPVVGPGANQATAPTQPTAPLGARVPTGPKLILQRGKSVGPIFFGATVETIERLMEAPCDIRTEDRCIFIKQAIEFYLEEGVMAGAKAHLRDRDVPGSEEKFGTFNGGMAPGLMLGLHRHVVLEEFEEPLEKEEVPLSGDTGLAFRHYHPGVVLEFDKIDNGNVVLSAFEIIPPAEDLGSEQSGAQR